MSREAERRADHKKTTMETTKGKITPEYVQKCKEQWLALSERVRGVLLGTVLGDSYVGMGGRNAYVEFRHSKTQEEYFKYKRDILRPEISGNKTNEADNKDSALRKANTEGGEHGTYKWHYKSQTLPALTYLYALTHEGAGKAKIVKRSTLNQLTPLSLAVL